MPVFHFAAINLKRITKSRALKIEIAFVQDTNPIALYNITVFIICTVDYNRRTPFGRKMIDRRGKLIK